MKQSEKYDLLQHALNRHVYETVCSFIGALSNDTFYSFNAIPWKGADIKEIWSVLLWFRDEARNREKLEEEKVPEKEE